MASKPKKCDNCGKNVEDSGTIWGKLWYHQRKSERFKRTKKTLCAKCIAQAKLREL